MSISACKVGALPIRYAGLDLSLIHIFSEVTSKKSGKKEEPDRAAGEGMKEERIPHGEGQAVTVEASVPVQAGADMAAVGNTVPALKNESIITEEMCIRDRREHVLELALQNQKEEAVAYMEANNIKTIHKAQAELDELCLLYTSRCV